MLLLHIRTPMLEDHGKAIVDMHLDLERERRLTSFAKDRLVPVQDTLLEQPLLS